MLFAAMCVVHDALEVGVSGIDRGGGGSLSVS